MNTVFDVGAVLFNWLRRLSSDVHLSQPDPAIYQELQNRYHLTPPTLLFIDDSKSKVHAARVLGWQGIHFESPQQLRAQLIDLGLISG